MTTQHYNRIKQNSLITFLDAIVEPQLQKDIKVMLKNRLITASRAKRIVNEVEYT